MVHCVSWWAGMVPAATNDHHKRAFGRVFLLCCGEGRCYTSKVERVLPYKYLILLLKTTILHGSARFP